MPELPDTRNERSAAHPVEPIFVRRWSPRAMSGAPLPDADLLFLYAHRDNPHFETSMSIPVDPTGQATARRIWRRFVGEPGRMIGEIPDNVTTKYQGDVL